MDKLKANRAIALRQVGIPKKDVEEYRKSTREYFVQYRGKVIQLLTSEILAKTKLLADIRRRYGVEIAGILFDDNLTVTYLFYVNDDPKDAFFEKNVFLSVSDYEKELDRQISSSFIPDMSEEKHVICKDGHEMKEIMLVNQ